MALPLPLRIQRQLGESKCQSVRRTVETGRSGEGCESGERISESEEVTEWAHENNNTKAVTQTYVSCPA